MERSDIGGIAEIVECVPPERRTSRWHLDCCYGFALRGAQPLPFTPMTGRRGVFDVPADILALIMTRQKEAA